MSQETQRVAIVTGAGRGIGAAVARRLATDGMAVAVLDLDEQSCLGTVKEITDAGGRAVGIGADVSKTDQVEAAVSRAASELGAPTVLVNNAGLLRDNLLFKMSDDDWDTVLDVHLKGSFLMSRATQKYMVEAKYGRIVKTSSSSALGNRGRGRHGFRRLQEPRRGRYPGPPGRGARGRGPHRFVPGQRGRGIRVRPGHLCGRGTVVLTPDDIRAKVKEFLAAHDPATTPRLDFLRARYDAGLAWVHYPEGRGGLGAPRALQTVTDKAFRAAGAPDNDPANNVIGLGMAAPTILTFGSAEQQERWLRPLWTGEEIWCQLFSEPGAGSDLASLATRAVRDDDGDWIVNGQKVWTSLAHEARWAILVARTDPDVPKHRGLTYFVCDMTDPGVDVRPLRQLSGEAEFNEVFLTDVRIPDSNRIAQVGEGWKVATGTLMNERVAIGGAGLPREGGMIGLVARAWRQHPDRRTPGLHDRLVRLWADAEVARPAGPRLRL